MRHSEAGIAYSRTGTGETVVLLHGWPGGRGDYDRVVPLLDDSFDVVVPDLRGFGASVKGPGEYDAPGQARTVLGLLDELGVRRAVLAGYDIGSRIAQAVARQRPELVARLVLSPPLPGIGERILHAHKEFWYQAFHQLPLAERLIDGNPCAVREYLLHFWTHWSGPSFTIDDDRLERLVTDYSAPGAFTASIAWYRAGGGAVAASLAEQVPQERIATPTAVLWPEHDPLFPVEWSDRIAEFFSDAHLTFIPDCGHFVPVERPETVADAIREPTAE
ncbi:alpha/beta fold hydrolase [Nonomuraea sediminis]|uniref:alpha/beta fold hydrolase n=1 Tax=Nonomuraea sediminis TaxID=2835864 RepID=UPI001BDD2C86|nr:alpha/beta hydrolase [Nonomuraea sediminis]